MHMPGGSTELIEVADLAVGLLNLFKGSGGKHSVSNNGGSRKGATETMVEAVKLALKSFGVGNYDEAEFAKLFGKLTNDEMTKWTSLMHKLDRHERKALQLRIYLMSPSGSTETETIAAVTDKDGNVKEPSKVITRSRDSEEDIRVSFMRTICATITDNGENGATVVADMLRTNEIIGDTSVLKKFEATTKRLLEQFDEQLTLLNDRFPKERKKVPMSLIGRIFNSTLIGSKEIPVPIFQFSCDGRHAIWKSPLRMLGVPVDNEKE